MTTSTSWPGIVETVRRSRTRQGRARSGYYSIEGTRLHARALRTGVSIEKSLVSLHVLDNPTYLQKELLQELERTGCVLVPIPDQALSDLIAGRDLGRLVGLVKIPRSIDLGELVAANNRRPMLILVAVEVVDPGNVGALLRTAHALGAQAMVTVGIDHVYHPRAVRMSRGSVFKVHTIAYDTPETLFAQLRMLGFRSVAMVAERGSLLTEAPIFAGHTAVFVGNEGQGLSQDLLPQFDQQISIPMASGIDSLSVNAAAAIVLWEIRRQWRIV